METGRRSAVGIRGLSFALVAGALALVAAAPFWPATAARTEGVGITTIEKAASAGVARVIAV